MTKQKIVKLDNGGIVAFQEIRRGKRRAGGILSRLAELSHDGATCR